MICFLPVNQGSDMTANVIPLARQECIQLGIAYFLDTKIPIMCVSDSLYDVFVKCFYLGYERAPTYFENCTERWCEVDKNRLIRLTDAPFKLVLPASVFNNKNGESIAITKLGQIGVQSMKSNRSIEELVDEHREGGKFKDKWACVQCNSSNDVKRQCSACHIVRYCNQTCQKKNWKKHKRYCSQLQSRYSTNTTSK